jgi:hypothetical protein
MGVLQYGGECPHLHCRARVDALPPCWAPAPDAGPPSVPALHTQKDLGRFGKLKRYTALTLVVTCN